MENKSGFYWDRFYQKNMRNFFKDRHWLSREFPELLHASEHSTTHEPPFIIGAGCGVGNTLFPVLQLNPKFHAAGFDFSRTAVEICKQRASELNLQDKTLFFPLDLTNEHERLKPMPVELDKRSPFQSLHAKGDIVALIFVLSALSPGKMPLAVLNLKYITKPGGLLCIRDYALNDMAQRRFENQNDEHIQIHDNFFARGDGTRAYYFELEEMRQLFAGWECVENRIVDKQVRNVKEGKVMNRKFIQSKFRLPLVDEK